MTKNKRDDEMIGFRDLLTNEDQTQSTGKSQRRHNDFELLTFLDQDSRRLSKHIDLYEEKVYILKNFSQDAKLLSEKSNELSVVKEKMIHLLQRKDSPLLKNLAEIFKKYF